MAEPRRKRLTDGLFEKNPVLISGLIAAPVIVCTTTLDNGLLLCAAFSLITFFSVLFSSFVPRHWPYGARIIVYTILAALVYVPVSFLCGLLFRNTTADLGLYFPLLTVNGMIAAQTEFLFDRRSKSRLAVSLLCYVVGFDLAVLLLSFLREFLAYGTLHGNRTGLKRTLDGLSTPAGGFLLLGLLAVLTRKLRGMFRTRRALRKQRRPQEDITA